MEMRRIPAGVLFDRAGTAAQKITIRGLRINGKRPVLSGGNNTIEAAGNHYVFEGLDLTNGTSRCFFHHADDIVLRDSVVHDCAGSATKAQFLIWIECS